MFSEAAPPGKKRIQNRGSLGESAVVDQRHSLAPWMPAAPIHKRRLSGSCLLRSPRGGGPALFAQRRGCSLTGAERNQFLHSPAVLVVPEKWQVSRALARVSQVGDA